MKTEDAPFYVIPSDQAETLLRSIQDINVGILAMTEILTLAIQQPYDADLEPIEQEKDDGPTAAN